MPDEKDGYGPAGNPNGDSSPPPPSEPTIEQRVMALESKSHAHDKNEHSGDHAAVVRKGEAWLIGINGFALLASIGIGIIYILQLRQMTKATTASACAANAARDAANTASEQFKLTRQQMIYTQAARVGMEVSLSYPSGAPEFIKIIVRNSGVQQADKVRAYFTIAEKTIDGQKTVWNGPPLSVTVPYSLAGSGTENFGGPEADPRMYSRSWPINTPEERIKQVWITKEFLELHITLSYFNGFENVVESPCLRYLIYWNRDNPNSSPNTLNFFPCSDFKEALATIRANGIKEDAYDKSQQTQKH